MPTGPCASMSNSSSGARAWEGLPFGGIDVDLPEQKAPGSHSFGSCIASLAETQEVTLDEPSQCRRKREARGAKTTRGRPRTKDGKSEQTGEPVRWTGARGAGGI